MGRLQWCSIAAYDSARDGIPAKFRWYKINTYLLYQNSFIQNMSNKLPVGILGATGIVGQRFIQMLEHHPWFEVAWLAASDRSEGRPYAEAARWRLKTAIPANVAKMTVAPAKPEGAPKIIFAALDASIARELEPQFAEAGCAVVSNSSALRMQSDVPLVIPEVNGDHIASDRNTILAHEIGRFRGHQSQLLGHWTGAGARSFASRVHA